jgi:fumarate reductase flavoprotein subunit
MGSIMAKSLIYVTGFYIMDSVAYRNAAASIDMITKYGGTIYEAKTVKDLATAAGIGACLVTEVSNYNEAIRSGTAASMVIPRVTNGVLIATPPYYAIPFRLASWGTLGGPLIDPTGNLLNVDGKPIPALYGAGALIQGSLTGGIENSRGSYVGCLGGCLIWGLVSSESAAVYARKPAR